MTDAMKLCRDCRHFVAKGETCLKSPHPVDYINGEPTGFHMAQTERMTFKGCGHEARYWEAK